MSNLTAALALSLLVVAAVPLAQTETAQLTDAQIEQFLSKARVTRTRSAPKGITGSTRATLTDGTLTHEAHIQTIDETVREFRSMREVEFNFRDSWTFNIAAYKIDRMLGLHLVPVSVERYWNGKRSAFTWWVDDVMMDEGERLAKRLQAPDLRCWNDQVRLLRVFDQLIENIDRNLGNMLITTKWRIWAIDHTRAFRRSPTPRAPKDLTKIDRTVLARLQELDEPTLKKAVGRYLDPYEIKALLQRRDFIVAHFQAMGEEVLFDRGSEPACADTVPVVPR
ncbi:MAG TPA: hypothetical protein VM364_13420 [Vicinamibacterales bacterium]|nr:hypothetical protein [Vicinamibacterales bacterium]